jgi:hypoxanthine phosphoribosyltransferase
MSTPSLPVSLSFDTGDGAAPSAMVGSLWAHRRLLLLSWTMLGECVDDLERQIRQGGFEPTTIVGVARGGLVLATALANRLKIRDFGVMSMIRNTADTRYSDRGAAQFSWIAPSPWDFSTRRVLIVDDIAGDGATLGRASQELRNRSALALRSAVLVKNHRCAVDPDYFARVADDWVVFPWETPPGETDAVEVIRA